MEWSGWAAYRCRRMAPGLGYERSTVMFTNSGSNLATIGIDIGKNSFHVVGLARSGAIVLRQKCLRGQVEARLANMPPCLIGMEACVGAHHLSRKLQSHGHDARLMPAKICAAIFERAENDFRDAEAIAEAVQRPTMKFVATKTCGPARSAGVAPGARTAGQPAHRHHQPDLVLSCWSAGLRCARAFVICAGNCQAFFPSAPTYCRRA